MGYEMTGIADLSSTSFYNSNAASDLTSMISSFGSWPNQLEPAYTVPQMGPVNLPAISKIGSTTSAATAGTTAPVGNGLFDYVDGKTKLNTWGKIGLGLQGLQTIGGLIGAFGSLSLANKQFNLQKDLLNTNLKNQIQAYNTALEDKARSRAAVEGQTSEQTAAYIAANKATR